MKKQTPKQIGRLYLWLEGAGVFCGHSFHGAIYMDFLMNNLHDYFWATAVNVVFFCTLFVAEIPTGAYADTFGRKASYVLASLLWSLGLIVYGTSVSFAGFALAECLLAIGSTCVSGAFEAWLIDSLDHSGMNPAERDAYKAHLFVRENTIHTVCGIFGSLIGAWVYTKSPQGCWVLSGVLMLCHALVAKYVMSEDYFERKTHTLKAHAQEMWSKTKSSIKFARTNQTIRTIALLATVQSFACMGTNMLWQPFFKEHVSVFWLGGLLSIWMVCGAIGAEIVNRYSNLNKKPIQTLKWSMIWSGILVVISALCPFPFSLIFFSLSQIPRGILNPIFRTMLHSAITDSKTRATTASCATMARYVGGAFGLLLSGLSAKYSSISLTWIWSGASLIFGAWWLCNRYQREHR
jgi:MFS transporter, DHA3 family, tetracycline resistance protein